MLHHPANEGIDIHRFAFHPLTAVGVIVVSDTAAIIAVDTSDRELVAMRWRWGLYWPFRPWVCNTTM
jgi:hypothetical protein